MEANELRIGNIVETPRQPMFRIDLFDYVSKGIGKLGQIHNRERHPLTWYLQDIRPIKISRQILRLTDLDVINSTWFGKGDFRINISGQVEIKDTYIGQFDYLHQVQNLYFLLTGNELQVHL